MIKYDSSGGKMASIEASGTPDDIVKDIVMLTVMLTRGMVKSGDIIPALYILKAVGDTLTDENTLKKVLFDTGLDDGMVATSPLEDETTDETRTRAMFEAIQKFAKGKKVDENWNVIEDEEDEE